MVGSNRFAEATCPVAARPDATDEVTAEELVGDILSAADRRSVLLITHRPEGLDLVDDVVLGDVASVLDET